MNDAVYWFKENQINISQFLTSNMISEDFILSISKGDVMWLNASKTGILSNSLGFFSPETSSSDNGSDQPCERSSSIGRKIWRPTKECRGLQQIVG